jgi:hypothetical protein
MNLPTVFWSVPCFDKRRAQPFPVYNRHFELDWSLLNENQVSDVLAIVNSKTGKTHSPSSLESTVVSIQRSCNQPDNRMLAYRKYFTERGEDAAEDNSLACTSFVCVNLNREYFEDENGVEISNYAMIQHVSGESEPVILGDPDSVLRLSHSPPVNVAEWSEQSANTLAQFLDVVRRICSSEWYRHPQAFTFEIQRGGDSSKFPETAHSKLLEAVFPNDSETLAVLAYFRQLHAKDKLLIRACDIFVRTCGDERKRFWVSERMESFTELIDSPPIPFNATETRRKIIQMFMYGAGLLHANSSHGDDKKLAELIKAQGKHRAVAVFNNCLWDILSIAITLYHVLKRDFDYWTGSCGLTGPTRIDIPTLFDGFTTQVDRGSK